MSIETNNILLIAVIILVIINLSIILYRRFYHSKKSEGFMLEFTDCPCGTYFDNKYGKCLSPFRPASLEGKRLLCNKCG